jgi:hypothetical protein
MLREGDVSAEAGQLQTNGQRALHVAPGEGEKRWVLGELITFKISGEDSAGAFALAEDVVPPKVGLLLTLSPTQT